MSTCYSTLQLPQNQEIDTQKSRKLSREASMPSLEVEKEEEDDIEDDESEFKMGRLIRQASLNSCSYSPPQTTKVMRESSSLPRYPLQKPERNQNRSKQNAPRIPAAGGWVDKGSSEDMKAQIKFWARAVAFNVHQES